MRSNTIVTKKGTQTFEPWQQAKQRPTKVFKRVTKLLLNQDTMNIFIYIKLGLLDSHTNQPQH